ncbi:MAG TPA: VanW family protein [Chloroflexota bacterium]|nr:VanW family protein [Chloroflexota bacterium]
MQSYAIMRSQAIPMAVYRRRLLLNQVRPYTAALCAMIVFYQASLLVSGVRAPLETVLPARILYRPVAPECTGGDAACVDRPDLLAPEAVPVPAPPPPAGQGAASLSGVGYVALTNIKIAVNFLDGTVIPPGEQLSFDDVAHTWDFQEDPIYLMSVATSIHGLIPMRGGGVCWLSTALWNAALEAGLETDFRENHYGLVPILGPGLDATNTLVIRNDSSTPITVHAWIDAGGVHAELDPEQPLDRTATVDGPVPLGGGSYVTYQTISWADGTEDTNEFYSHYYW